MTDNIRVVRLTQDYQFKSFDCGNQDLNDFLLSDSKPYLKKLLSVTYIFETDVYYDLTKLVDWWNSSIWTNSIGVIVWHAKETKKAQAQQPLTIDDVLEQSRRLGRTSIRLTTSGQAIYKSVWRLEDFLITGICSDACFSLCPFLPSSRRSPSARLIPGISLIPSKTSIPSVGGSEGFDVV